MCGFVQGALFIAHQLPDLVGAHADPDDHVVWGADAGLFDWRVGIPLLLLSLLFSSFAPRVPHLGKDLAYSCHRPTGLFWKR